MINNLLRGFIYFVVFVLIQVLILNNIHFLRIATPFLYLYFIIKMPSVAHGRKSFLLFHSRGGYRYVQQHTGYACDRLYIGGILQGAVNPCIHGERFAGRYLPVL